MKAKLYLDMDGTLVDFVSQVNKYGYWRTDKENKVDWDKVKAMGSRFWSEMDWFPGAKDPFKSFQEWDSQGKIELYILSSIDFDSGVEGKKLWITSHTDFPLEKVIFCVEPGDKVNWADKDSWLVDDRKKSLDPFQQAGGNVIEFTGDWKKVVEEVGKSYLGK